MTEVRQALFELIEKRADASLRARLVRAFLEQARYALGHRGATARGRK